MGAEGLFGGTTWDTAGHEDRLATIPVPTANDPIVAAALLAAAAPRFLARQAAALSRVRPGRAQRTRSRQSPARRPRCHFGRMSQTQHPGSQQEPLENASLLRIRATPGTSLGPVSRPTLTVVSARKAMMKRRWALQVGGRDGPRYNIQPGTTQWDRSRWRAPFHAI